METHIYRFKDLKDRKLALSCFEAAGSSSRTEGGVGCVFQRFLHHDRHVSGGDERRQR